ncbi:hypothetical protein H1R20_g9120, partial [Candolleomyces eurysporus]
MLSATSEIPQEIIDLVTDQTQSDSATLQALSLVSRAWSLRTRECLFHSIELSAEEKCTTLRPLLEERPSLRHCVKALTIRVATPYSWLNENPSESILAILPILDSLTRFSIHGKFEPSGSLNWKALSPKVQIALYEVMARPHVTSITLSSIYGFDIMPLTQYGHLEELILDVVEVTHCNPVKCGALLPLNDSPSSSSSIPVWARLRRLDVTTSPRAFRALLPCSERRDATLDLSNLTHLKVNTSNDPQEFKDTDWNSLFDMCGASIESYTVHQRAYGRPVYERPVSPAVIPLYRFPNLKEFFLMIEYQTSEQRGHNSFPIFVEALERLSQGDNEAHLSTIRVEYDGCAKYIEKEINDLLDGQRWRWLDEILQRPAFLRLREVKFGFTLHCCRDSFWNENWGEHSGRISSQLLNLDRRGILTLTRPL